MQHLPPGTRQYITKSLPKVSGCQRAGQRAARAPERPPDPACARLLSPLRASPAAPPGRAQIPGWHRGEPWHSHSPGAGGVRALQLGSDRGTPRYPSSLAGPAIAPARKQTLQKEGSVSSRSGPVMGKFQICEHFTNSFTSAKHLLFPQEGA